MCPYVGDLSLARTYLGVREDLTEGESKRTRTSSVTDRLAPWSTDILLSSSAGTNIAETYELVELMLIHLPYFSLLRCTQVSHAWRTIINRSFPLQRLLHKTPTLISTSDPNPHFSSVSADASTVTIPEGIFAGSSVLATTQSHITTFLDKITPLHVGTAEANKALKEYERARWRISAGFRGIRVPNGWPRELQEIHCECCEGFHGKVRTATLHPVMRFLEDVDICCTGKAGRVPMAVYKVHYCGFILPLSCWEHFMVQTLAYIRGLRGAMDAVAHAGMHGDLFMRPVVTDLVLLHAREDTDREVIRCLHDENGVRLGQALPALVSATMMDLWELVRAMARFQPKMTIWNYWSGAGSTSTNKFLFPTREHFAAYVNGWPGMVQRFLTEVLEEVNELASGLEAWKWTGWPGDHASRVDDSDDVVAKQ